MEPRKQAIIDALAKFMNRRSGIEFGNYGDVKAFRAEQRSIYTDLRQARVLLAAVKWRDGIDADALIKAASGAFSGRLTIRELEWKQYAPEDCPGKPCSKDCDHRQFRGFAVDYCTGQYFPTEYRRAVCAVLASALWEYTREKCMPAIGSENRRMSRTEGREGAEYRLNGRWMTPGDWLRAHFRKEFGRFIAARWFS